MTLPRSIGLIATLRTVRCSCDSIVAVYLDGTLAEHTQHRWTKNKCELSGRSMNDYEFPVTGYVVWDLKTNAVRWIDFSVSTT